MGEAIVAVLDVLLKCAEGIREVDKGLKEEKREGETRGFEEEGSRPDKAVYSCGARLVRAARNVDVEDMM